MTGPPAAFHHSREFLAAAQRSEIKRATMMLAVLLVLGAVGVLRNATGGVVLQGDTFVWTLVLLGAGAVFELSLLVLARRADRAGRLLPNRLWTGATTIESLLPTGAILIAQLTSSIGGVRAFAVPAILTYGIVMALSIMRLSPALCLLSGGLSATGNFIAVLIALRAGASAGDPLSWPTMLSFPINLALGGVAAAMVASEVRSHVARALHEATERQRVQLVARNTLIFGLAKLAEYRDSDTGTHLDRISAYSEVLARALRAGRPFITDAWIQTLCVASSMHDIGKVGVPDAVLCKPGRLTDEERLVIQTHPRLGSAALEAILARHGADDLLEMSAQIAACHHERWDGGGYPAKLKGEQIPLTARIIAVADVYDALTSPRVYKPAMPHAEAARLISEGRTTQFDPAVVDAFMQASAEFERIRARFANAEKLAPAV